jgi:hypothetical protein
MRKALVGDAARRAPERDWGRTDYATVAMRYSLHDRMIDHTTGRVVDGAPSLGLDLPPQPWGPLDAAAIQQV